MSRRHRSPWTPLLVCALVTLALFLSLGAASANTPLVRLEPAPSNPPGVALVGQDTLHATPWVELRLRAWAPEQPQAFCVRQFAGWPGFLYLKELETAGSPKCEGAKLVLIQAPRCPTQSELEETPPFVIVQCGIGNFRRNNTLVDLPSGNKIA